MRPKQVIYWPSFWTRRWYICFSLYYFITDT